MVRASPADESVLSVPVWLYLPVFKQLALALALGLSIDMETYRHRAVPAVLKYGS